MPLNNPGSFGAIAGWTTQLTLNNNWAPMTAFPSGDLGASLGGFLAPFGYLRDQTNVIWLRGRIRGGNAGSVILTLPVGFRPEYSLRQRVAAHNGTALVLATIAVGTTGQVAADFTATATNAWISLDHFCFRAA